MVQPTPSPWCPHVHAKGMRARGRVCEWGSMQPRWGSRQMEGWVHQSGGAKRSWRQVTVRPHVHAKGEGVQVGWCTNRKGHALSTPPHPVDQLREILCSSVLSN